MSGVRLLVADRSATVRSVLKRALGEFEMITVVGDTADGRDVLFLPTSPNITTGFVLEVDPADYEETDERVEDALTRILSAGFGDTNDPKQTIPIAGEDD